MAQLATITARSADIQLRYNPYSGECPKVTPLIDGTA